jgi:hypothetical protein
MILLVLILTTFKHKQRLFCVAMPILEIGLNHTECCTDLDKQSNMIILGLILITFKSSSIFGGSCGSIENWLEPKTKTKFSFPKSVKCSVSSHNNQVKHLQIPDTHCSHKNEEYYFEKASSAFTTVHNINELESMIT